MIDKTPTVSVIIPTYNRADLIKRAIKSVLNQTYQNFEIIVVDDASSDNTEEIIKELQKQDGRIRYMRHKVNMGGSAARNTGINEARGEYIAFQDSDDEWLPKKLEKQMEVFKAASLNVGVVYSGFVRYKKDEKFYFPQAWVKRKEGFIHKELLKRNFIGTPVVVVRKLCFERVGLFNTSLSHLQDWELWIRVSNYYKFIYINETLTISYYTPNSVNDKPLSDNIKTIEMIISWHYNEFAKYKRILSEHYFILAFKSHTIGDFGKAKKFFLKAVKANPLNLKYILALILFLFGKNIFNSVVKKYRKLKTIFGITK